MSNSAIWQIRTQRVIALASLFLARGDLTRVAAAWFQGNVLQINIMRFEPLMAHVASSPQNFKFGPKFGRANTTKQSGQLW
jgi:hypothetical protein